MVALDGEQSHDACRGKNILATFTFTLRFHLVLARSLTPYEEVAAHNEHDTDGGQDETGPVQVVLVAHKADPAHRVSIHLHMCKVKFNPECSGSSYLFLLAKIAIISTTDITTTHNCFNKCMNMETYLLSVRTLTSAMARMATVRIKGMDHVTMWK